MSQLADNCTLRAFLFTSACMHELLNVSNFHFLNFYSGAMKVNVCLSVTGQSPSMVSGGNGPHGPSARAPVTPEFHTL